MPRKILFIIIGALLFLALLALLWFWFIHRSPAADPDNQSGFGTSTDRGNTGTNTTGGGNTPGNVDGGGTASGPSVDYNVTQTPDGYLISTAGGLDSIAPGTYQIKKGTAILGTFTLSSNGVGKYTIPGGNLPTGAYTFTPFILGNSGIGGSINVGGGINTGGGLPPGGTINTGGGLGSTTINTGTTTVPTGTTTPPGGALSGAWFGSSISERVFSASDIADIMNPGTLGGTPLISTTPQPASVNNSGLVIGLTAAACLAQWVANQVAGAVAFLDPVVATSLFTDVPSLDKSAAKQRTSQSVITCIVKTIAQAAIDQITRSIVNWVNSGFNGQPSFVTNFNQYFANVADQAAGEFIKGSALSFLCSPFAPQIKIAIAQSYANRNAAASCTLTKVTNNVNGFLKGNFGAGGWGSMLQLTTMPTNNPYGSFAYAEISVKGAVANAQNNANRNISPGGFISIQKCDDTPLVNIGTGKIPTNKNCKVTTPGQVVQDSLKTSFDSSVNQLQVAQNIDEIIRALVNQLILKSLYGGLANANTGVTNPLTPAVDQAASAQAQALLASLQGSATAAVQYATAKQGSASDIQQVQNNFNIAYNCWQNAASSTALSSAQQATAAQNAAAADVQIDLLQVRVDTYNNDITTANTSLSTIQNLQSQVMFAATPEDIQAATYAVQAATPSLLGAADVTTAQQDRAALQTQLTATNSQAQASLAQCRAFGA